MRIVVLFLLLLAGTVVGLILLLSVTTRPASPEVDRAPEAATPRAQGTAGPAPAAHPGDAAVVPFLIHEGQSTDEIAQALQQEGLVTNTVLFRLVARLRGVDDKLQAGEYQLRRDMSVDELLLALQHAPA